MNSIFGFLGSRPQGGVPLLAWQSFRSEILTLSIGIMLVSAALIVGLYAWRTRKLTIQQPGDPFSLLSGGYWLGWAALCLVPGVGMGLVYFLMFRQSFPNVQASAVPSSFGSFLFTSAGVLALFQILIWIEGITPAKFLYHPRWPWRLLARRRS